MLPPTGVQNDGGIREIIRLDIENLMSSERAPSNFTPNKNHRRSNSSELEAPRNLNISTGSNVGNDGVPQMEKKMLENEVGCSHTSPFTSPVTARMALKSPQKKKFCGGAADSGNETTSSESSGSLVMKISLKNGVAKIIKSPLVALKSSSYRETSCNNKNKNHDLKSTPKTALNTSLDHSNEDRNHGLAPKTALNPKLDSHEAAMCSKETINHDLTPKSLEVPNPKKVTTTPSPNKNKSLESGDFISLSFDEDFDSESDSDVTVITADDIAKCKRLEHYRQSKSSADHEQVPFSRNDYEDTRDNICPKNQKLKSQKNSFSETSSPNTKDLKCRIKTPKLKVIPPAKEVQSESQSTNTERLKIKIPKTKKTSSSESSGEDSDDQDSDSHVHQDDSYDERSSCGSDSEDRKTKSSLKSKRSKKIARTSSSESRSVSKKKQKPLPISQKSNEIEHTSSSESSSESKSKQKNPSIATQKSNKIVHATSSEISDSKQLPKPVVNIKKSSKIVEDSSSESDSECSESEKKRKTHVNTQKSNKIVQNQSSKNNSKSSKKIPDYSLAKIQKSNSECSDSKKKQKPLVSIQIGSKKIAESSDRKKVPESLAKIQKSDKTEKHSSSIDSDTSSSENASEHSDSKKLKTKSDNQKKKKVKESSSSESSSDVTSTSEDSDSRRLKTSKDILKKKTFGSTSSESSSGDTNDDTSSSSSDSEDSDDKKKSKTSTDLPKKKKIVEVSTSEGPSNSDKAKLSVTLKRSSKILHDSSSESSSEDSDSKKYVANIQKPRRSDSTSSGSSSEDSDSKKSVVNIQKPSRSDSSSSGSSSEDSDSKKSVVNIQKPSRSDSTSSGSSSEDLDSKRAPKSVANVQKLSRSDSSSSGSSSDDTSDQSSHSSEHDSEESVSKEKSKPVVDVQKLKTSIQVSSLKSDHEEKNKDREFKCSVKIPLSRLKLDSQNTGDTHDKPKSIVKTKNLEKEENSVKTELYKTSKPTEKSKKNTSNNKNHCSSIVDLFAPDLKIKVAKKKKVADSSAKKLHFGDEMLASDKIPASLNPVLCIKKLNLQDYTALGYGSYFVGTDEALAVRLFEQEKKEAKRGTQMRVDYYEFDWPESSDSDDGKKSNKIKSKGGKSGHSSGKSGKKKTKKFTSDPEHEVKPESAKSVELTQKLKSFDERSSAVERPSTGPKSSKIIEDGLKSTESLQITVDRPHSTSSSEATKVTDGKSSVPKCSLKEPKTTEDRPKSAKEKSNSIESKATKVADEKSRVPKCSLKEPKTTEDLPKSIKGKSSSTESKTTKVTDGKSSVPKCSLKEPKTAEDRPKSIKGKSSSTESKTTKVTDGKSSVPKCSLKEPKTTEDRPKSAKEKTSLTESKAIKVTDEKSSVPKCSLKEPKTTENRPKSTQEKSSLTELEATKVIDGKSSVPKCSLKEPKTIEDRPKSNEEKFSSTESEKTKVADGKSSVPKCSLKEPKATEDQPKCTKEKLTCPKKSLSLTKKLKSSIKTLKKLSVDKGLKLIKKKSTKGSLLLHSESSQNSSYSNSGIKIKSAEFVDTSDSDTTEVKSEPQKEPKRLTADSTEKPKLDEASDLRTIDTTTKAPKEKTIGKPVNKSDKLKSKPTESSHGKQLATTKIKSKEFVESSDTSDDEMVPKSIVGSSAKEPTKHPKEEMHSSANESKSLEYKSKTVVEQTTSAERPKSVENEAHLLQKSSHMKPQSDLLPSSSIDDPKVTCEKKIHSASAEDKMRVNIESSSDKPKSTDEKVEISHVTLPSTETSKPKEKFNTTSKSSIISRATEEKIKTDYNTSKPSVVPRLIEDKTNTSTSFSSEQSVTNKPCSSADQSKSADKIKPKSTDKSHAKPKSTDDKSQKKPKSTDKSHQINSKSTVVKSHTKPESSDDKSQKKPKSTDDKSQLKPKSTDDTSQLKPKSTDDNSQKKPKSVDDKSHINKLGDKSESPTDTCNAKSKSSDKSQDQQSLSVVKSSEVNCSSVKVNFSKKKTKKLVITSDSADEMKQPLEHVEVTEKRRTYTDEKSSAVERPGSAPKITENELKSTEALKVTDGKSCDRSEPDEPHRRDSRDEKPQDKSKSSHDSHKSSEKYKLTDGKLSSVLPKTVVGKSRDRSSSMDSKSEKSKSSDIPKLTEKPKSTHDSKSVEKSRQNSVDKTKDKSKPSLDKLQRKPSHDSTEEQISKSSDGLEKTKSDKSEDKPKSSHVRTKSIDSKSSHKTDEGSDEVKTCEDSFKSASCDPATLSSENKVQQSQSNKDTTMVPTESANTSLPKSKHDKKKHVSKHKVHTSKKLASSENKHIPENIQKEKQTSSEKFKSNECKVSEKITDLKVSNKLYATSEFENKCQSDDFSVKKSTESNDKRPNSKSTKLENTEMLDADSKKTAASENNEQESESNKRKLSSDNELSCKVQLISVDTVEKDAKKTVVSTLKHKLNKSGCDKENALSPHTLKSKEGQQKSTKETHASMEELTDKSLHSREVKVESVNLTVQTDAKSTNENLKILGKTKECFLVLPKLKSVWKDRIEASRPLSAEPPKSLKLFVSECLERPNSAAGVIDTEQDISKSVLELENKSKSHAEPVVVKSKPVNKENFKSVSSDATKESKFSRDQKDQPEKLISIAVFKECKLAGEDQKKQTHERSSSQGKAPKSIKSRTLSLDRKPKEDGENRSKELQGDGSQSIGEHHRTEKGSKLKKERSKSLSERPKTCMKSSESDKERRESTDKKVKTSDDKSVSQPKHKPSTEEKSGCKKSDTASKRSEEHSHIHAESTATKRHHDDSVDATEPLLKKPKIVDQKKNKISEEPESDEPKFKKLKLSTKKSNLSLNKISSKSSVIPSNKTLRIVLQDIKNIWTQPKPGVFRIGKITFTKYKENKHFDKNGTFGKKSQKYITSRTSSTFKIPFKKSHSSDQNKSLTKETSKSLPLLAAANKIKERSLLNIQKTQKFKPELKEVETKKLATKFKKLQSNLDRNNVSVATSSPLDVLEKIGESKPKVVAENVAATESSSAGFSLDSLLTQMSASYPVKQDTTRDPKKCTIVKEHPVEWAQKFIYWKFLSSDLYKQRVTRNDFDLHTPVTYQLKDYMENSYNVEVRDMIEQDRQRRNKYKTSRESRNEEDSSDDEDDCCNKREISYSDWLSCKFYDARIPEPTDVPDFDSIPVISPALEKHVVIERCVLPANPSTPSTSNDETSPNVNYYDDYEIDNQGNYLDDQQNAEDWEEEEIRTEQIEDTDMRQESVNAPTFTRSPSPFPAARNPSPPPFSVPALSFLQRTSAGNTKLNVKISPYALYINNTKHNVSPQKNNTVNIDN